MCQTAGDGRDFPRSVVQIATGVLEPLAVPRTRILGLVAFSLLRRCLLVSLQAER